MHTIDSAKAKPFLKWAGGKTQLLPAIDRHLPRRILSESKVTYIEPFVGGGAVLFHLLRKYPNISHAVINDINPRLINAYRVIKQHPAALTAALMHIQNEYRSLDTYDRQKEYYLQKRDLFNGCQLDPVDECALLIFLNRTCFNGLYRENSSGKFNVPCGRYVHPSICDKELIEADSRLLQKVEILNGDFSETKDCIDGYTFFYFDPPYRPLSSTSNFNSYVKEAFNDDGQRRLKDFFAAVSLSGADALLSNSDGHAANPDDVFFDTLYSDFIIERVFAKRSINANPSKRGLLTELLIRNYTPCIQPTESEHQ